MVCACLFRFARLQRPRSSAVPGARDLHLHWIAENEKLQGPADAGRRISWSDCASPLCAIQTRSKSAGSVATVVSRKNGTHPRRSASTPPDEATSVRPTAASDDSSAYCVAVNAGEQRL